MKRLVSIAVSLAILGVIYWRIDVGGLVAALGASDLAWLAAALLALAPIAVVTAWRFTRLVPDSAHIGLGEAVRLTLAASSLNLVLPSKMGDLAKAWFIRERGHMAGSLAVALVVYEKTCDMLALLVWCVFGLLLYAGKGPLFWAMTGTAMTAAMATRGRAKRMGNSCWGRGKLSEVAGRRQSAGPKRCVSRR